MDTGLTAINGGSLTALDVRKQFEPFDVIYQGTNVRILRSKHGQTRHETKRVYMDLTGVETEIWDETFYNIDTLVNEILFLAGK